MTSTETPFTPVASTLFDDGTDPGVFADSVRQLLTEAGYERRGVDWFKHPMHQTVATVGYGSAEIRLRLYPAGQKEGAPKEFASMTRIEHIERAEEMLTRWAAELAVEPSDG